MNDHAAPKTPVPDLPGKVLAVFDFDGTLVRGDSFWFFLAFVAGWPKVIAIVVGALLRRLFMKPRPEARTFLKAALLRGCLAGRRVEDLQPAILRLKRHMRALPTVTALCRHYADGHHVVIASGGLDFYLPKLLEDTPHHALICTEIAVVDGVIEGSMKNGNCVRQRKAELVADYIAQHGPFANSWGYGNLPHDAPMLQLVKNRVFI